MHDATLVFELINYETNASVDMYCQFVGAADLSRGAATK